MGRYEDEMLRGVAEARWSRMSYGCVSAAFLLVVLGIVLFF
jgi:hypothetical protein